MIRSLTKIRSAGDHQRRWRAAATADLAALAGQRGLGPNLGLRDVDDYERAAHLSQGLCGRVLEIGLRVRGELWMAPRPAPRWAAQPWARVDATPSADEAARADILWVMAGRVAPAAVGILAAEVSRAGAEAGFAEAVIPVALGVAPEGVATFLQQVFGRAVDHPILEPLLDAGGELAGYVTDDGRSFALVRLAAR